MGELLDYFRSRVKKDNSSSDDEMKKTKVKNAISDLCDRYLKDVDDVFKFEVLPSDLPYAVMVIEEEPLKSKYYITQVDKTLFEAVLKELEL